jgi:hypothetical protein
MSGFWFAVGIVIAATAVQIVALFALLSRPAPTKDARTCRRQP